MGWLCLGDRRSIEGPSHSVLGWRRPRPALIHHFDDIAADHHNDRSGTSALDCRVPVHADAAVPGRDQRSLQAIIANSAALGSSAYFPESAYLQLKKIDNARSDYVNRLEADFILDIGAAHALLGSDANTAKLLEATAPSGFGHWVPPGVCDNSIGYYELPNAVVIYQEDGQTRSFGIASMISWAWSVVRGALW